jgi:hypothetical protein
MREPARIGKVLRFAAFTTLLLQATAYGTPAPSPSVNPGASSLATFEKRLAAAKSVKVRQDILGIKLDTALATARQHLDPLAAPDGRPPEEQPAETEAEGKLLWKLSSSDYSSVLLKPDREDQITYILGLLRPGKEIPFEKIGEVAKAPIATDKVVAWDVVRPDRSLIRVVARGAGGKANSITIFLVKRPRR